jgi:hypothetical protein
VGGEVSQEGLEDCHFRKVVGLLKGR